MRATTPGRTRPPAVLVKDPSAIGRIFFLASKVLNRKIAENRVKIEIFSVSAENYIRTQIEDALKRRLI